ncbi:MAG: hypothetical protein JWM49_403 [Microbacteriaceae bacterium]|jgi:ABC-type glycerol-3-phosphate transport system substrate-binding protein|nr:hypothetical protein [Microbacteriaceae bacterium]
MRTKRTIIAAAAALALITMAAGCSSPNPSGAKPASAASTAPVTITFATNMTGSGAGTPVATNKLLAEFHKKYPNVTVQLQTAQSTALQPLIQLAFASKKVPDVFNFWRPQPAFNMDKYIATGQLADLTSIAKPMKDEFPASAWATATVDGKVRGLPLVNFAVPLIVNTQVFKKAGLPLPTTWKLLVSDVAALKKQGIIPWTVSTQPVNQSDDRLFDYVLDRSLGNQKALDLFQGKGSFTSPNVQKAVDDYMSISTNMGPSDAAALDDNAAIAKYLNTGKSAMLIDNSGYLPAIDKSLGPDMKVIPFPTIPGGQQKTTNVERDLTTLLYASTASLKDPAKKTAVTNFLTFMTSVSAQTEFANNSVLVPAIKAKPDATLTGPLFAQLQTVQATQAGDKWLGNARTPSQQQTFYPLMAQQWAGAFTSKEFAQQLDTMFKQ